jgi:hypothetical protein
MRIGFTAPAVAEPFSGEFATRAFFVVFRELISDFFWIVMIFAPRRLFVFVLTDAIRNSTGIAKPAFALSVNAS